MAREQMYHTIAYGSQKEAANYASGNSGGITGQNQPISSQFQNFMRRNEMDSKKRDMKRTTQAELAKQRQNENRA